jgi:hypothetical protein
MKASSSFRGLLLGASMALLLAGGVALAQGLSLTADQTCFECWEYEGEDLISSDEAEPQPFILPPDDKSIDLTLTGYHTEGGYGLCPTFTVNGQVVSGPMCFVPPPQDPLYAAVFALCPPYEEVVYLPYLLPSDANATNGLLPYEYGQWSLRICEEPLGVGVQQADSENCDEVSFLFAEDCAAATFVPEPGTIGLLASGLAGLAGYAVLRLRSRQALR